ncbi:MAG: hypothetical protein C5B51_00700, partial [Terriglobia bacterium]
MFRVCAAVHLLSLFAWAASGTVCPQTYVVAPGDTLQGIADWSFGDAKYWPALVLATNSRLGEDFRFISDSNDLRAIPKICVPEFAEAERWRLRYEKYLAAIRETALPEPWEVVPRLVEFPSDRPIDVATWIRVDQVKKTYQDSTGAWLRQAPGEIWVTVEPYLQKFCSAFEREHGSDPDQLTMRLEQRLGLPPVSGKTTFLEIR